MVAWCQEANGTIPPSQLLQVKHGHVFSFPSPPRSNISPYIFYFLQDKWIFKCSLLLSPELLKLQQLSWDPGIFVCERDGQEIMEETVCVFKTVRIVLLNKRNIKGEMATQNLNFAWFLSSKKKKKTTHDHLFCIKVVCTSLVQASCTSLC